MALLLLLRRLLLWTLLSFLLAASVHPRDLLRRRPTPHPAATPSRRLIIILQALAGSEEEYQGHTCTGNDPGLSVQVAALEDGLYSRAAVALYTLVDNIDPTSGSGVSVMYQCRGDLALSDCPLCVQTAFAFLSRNCSNDPSYAHVELKGCGIKYSNQRIEEGNYVIMAEYYNIGNGSTTFVMNRGTAIANITQQAIANKKILGTYWAVNVVGNGTADACYALAQCHGYLAPSNCSLCLSLAADFLNTFIWPQSLGQRCYYESCFIRYEDSLFYNANNTPSLLTSLGPPPSPAPSPNSPFPDPPLFTPKAPSINTSLPPAPAGRITIVPLAAVLGSLLIFATLLLLFICWQRRLKKLQKQLHYTEDNNWMEDGTFESHRVHSFSIQELRRATQNFDKGNILGRGAFGQVYKGTLGNGEAVAVKKLNLGISDRAQSQFVAEVKFITSVQHRNLIRLHGYCVDSADRILVYEFLPNLSLDKHIFSTDKEVRQKLRWKKRLDILLGAARGLAYLHHDCPHRIIHRDIKAANILLDEKLNAKIADFGLAKLFEMEATHVADTAVAGTPGYLAPEYLLHGRLTEKADVYSFGVVMLEVVSGRKVILKHNTSAAADDDDDDAATAKNLLPWARRLFESKGGVRELVDAALQEDVDYNPEQATAVVSLALSCTQELSRSRPSMTDVLGFLSRLVMDP